MSDCIFLGINRIRYISLPNLQNFSFFCAAFTQSYKAQTDMEICVLNLCCGVIFLAPVCGETGLCEDCLLESLQRSGA